MICGLFGIHCKKKIILKILRVHPPNKNSDYDHRDEFKWVAARWDRNKIQESKFHQVRISCKVRILLELKKVCALVSLTTLNENLNVDCNSQKAFLWSLSNTTMSTSLNNIVILKLFRIRLMIWVLILYNDLRYNHPCIIDNIDSKCFVTSTKKHKITLDFKRNSVFSNYVEICKRWIWVRGRPFLRTFFSKRTMFGWKLTHPPTPPKERNWKKIRTPWYIICTWVFIHILDLLFIMECLATVVWHLVGTNKINLHENYTI